MRRIEVGKWIGRTLVLAAALALAAGTAHANTLPDATTLPRALQYIGCAVGVASAAAGVGLAMVLMSCLLLIAEP
jgi:hypothetical protein